MCDSGGRSVEGMKNIQIPTSTFQKNSKAQAPRTFFRNEDLAVAKHERLAKGAAVLNFGFWSFSGIWMVEFGI
jgi:hypothetical protein